MGVDKLVQIYGHVCLYISHARQWDSFRYCGYHADPESLHWVYIWIMLYLDLYDIYWNCESSLTSLTLQWSLNEETPTAVVVQALYYNCMPGNK